MKPFEVIIKSTATDPGHVNLGDAGDGVLPRVGEAIRIRWTNEKGFLNLDVRQVIHDFIDRYIIIVCTENTKA